MDQFYPPPDARIVYGPECKLEIPASTGEYHVGAVSYHPHCYDDLERQGRTPRWPLGKRSTSFVGSVPKCARSPRPR
jgi:hypothetical protein